MTSITNQKKESQDSENVSGPVVTVTTLPDVKSARTTEELDHALTILDRHATDLVASDVVRDGYLAHGHPHSLGFQHLSTMTSSRIKKRFPLFTREEPLYRILWVQGRVIVGEELVKKYEARKSGKVYDYTKAINKRFEKMFKELDTYKDLLLEIHYEDVRRASGN